MSSKSKQSPNKTSPSSPVKKNVSTNDSGTASSAEHLIKLLLIGDSGVGKSCLLMRFCDDSFTPSFISTIGIDFKLRTLQLTPSCKCRLQIWDTAGQERFRTITTAYYRGAMGILIVYDVCDERSFGNVRNWVRNVEQFGTEGVEMTLVGNKCDANDKRVVSRERGEALATELGISFIETSAKAGVNVEEAFALLTSEVKKKLDARNVTDKTDSKKRINLLPSGETLRKSCCWGGSIPQETSSLAKNPTSQLNSPSKRTTAFAPKPE